ncbi:MAG: glycosyltransferase family 4 protein [Candidatus Thermoplasmatota archaeon]|nr:glycosyltransferase family 4 protein [Candidatus Thermoplasmatota archaeon]
MISINSPFDEENRSIGGAEWSMRLLGSQLARSGHNVHYITKGRLRSGVDIVSGISVHRVWMPYIPLLHRIMKRIIILNDVIQKWSLRSKISSLMKRHSFDIMITYTPHPAGYCIAKQTKGRPVIRIQRIGGKFWERIGETPGNDLDSMRTSLRETDLFISNCDHLAEEFKLFHIKTMGYEPRTIVQEIGQEIIEKKKVKSVSGRLVSVGSLKNYQKSQEILIKALDLLIKRGRDLELVLVGDGPNREYLQKLTSELGLDGKVIFTGFLSMEDAREETSKGSIYVHASEWEGVSKAILDAMLLERAIVASDVGGIDEYILHEKTGLLSRNDPVAFADAVERLLDDPSFAQEIGERARKHVIESYDPKKNVLKYEMIFKKEMQRKKRTMRSR